MLAVEGNANCWLYVGDCRNIFWSCLDEGEADFVFADPPFNIDHPYTGFDDNMTAAEYYDFTGEWMASCWRVLNPACGVMAVHVPDAVVYSVLSHAARLGMHRLAWVIWHYRFGQCGRSNWISSKCHCLIFARDPKQRTWNPDAVLVDSDRATKYNDKRTEESGTPGKRVPLDVWGLPEDGQFWGRVQGNNRERRKGHPNQLPEVYLERLIRAYTNRGDLVADPFVGSGTTPTVALALGRRFFGCDVSEENATSAADRIKNGAIRI